MLGAQWTIGLTPPSVEAWLACGLGRSNNSCGRSTGTQAQCLFHTLILAACSVQVGVVGLYVVRECVLLACALEAGGGSGVPNTGTFDAYIATSNLADSVWFAILLSIAAGFW